MNMKDVSGLLLLYHCPWKANAPTIDEHIGSFARYSQYKVCGLNVDYGYPDGLGRFTFAAIVLHYSLFGDKTYLCAKFQKYLMATSSLKIAFFQDEHHNCRNRLSTVRHLNIDVIYSLLDPKYHDIVYRSNSDVNAVLHTLTGYVDDSLVMKAQSYFIPERDRAIDIGYRARPLPYYSGMGGQEKTCIADEVVRRLSGSGLRLDIKTSESGRIYGEHWYRFVANCIGMIGVEAGVSVFDLYGNAEAACAKYLAVKPSASFEEVQEAVLKPFEDNIPYRTISPRVFEAAAFRVCMILFEGRYNDILKPMVHYIPLKKDFSNFEWVMSVFSDETERRRLTDNAYVDLVQSGRYSYRMFVDGFDEELRKRGLSAEIDGDEWDYVMGEVRRDERRRLLLRQIKLATSRYVTSKPVLKAALDPLISEYRSRRWLKL
jgi:hypothetical protein